MSAYNDVEAEDLGCLYLLKVYNADGSLSYSTTASKEKYLKARINRIKRYNEHGYQWGPNAGIPPENKISYKIFRLTGVWKDYELPDPKQKVLFK